MSNPFDYVRDITQEKKNLIVDEDTEKAYNPFLVNRALSYHRDCIMFSNEMNVQNHIDKKLQNDFLLNTVRSYKRPYSKWFKHEINEDVEYIAKYFGISMKQAREYLTILSKEQIQEIKQKTITGGLTRT